MSDFDFSDKTKELFGNPEAFMKTPDFDKMLKGDMVGYDSPIQVIASQIEMSMDGEILKACQRVGVDVNKDELIKALNYDREQYEKGYRDAQSKLKPMCSYLTKCMSHPDISRDYHDWCSLYGEDCNCQCCSRKA